MPRTCRECGCSDNNPCIDENGQTCAWAADDLCTFCAETQEPRVQLYSEGDLRRLTG
jgi:hypothetical protein